MMFYEADQRSGDCFRCQSAVNAKSNEVSKHEKETIISQNTSIRDREKAKSIFWYLKTSEEPTVDLNPQQTTNVADGRILF